MASLGRFRRKRSMTDESITIEWRRRSDGLQSWTSSGSHGTIKEEMEEETKESLVATRGKVIEEIVAVEKAYIESLNTVVTYYYYPLLSSGPIQGLKEQQALTLIFGQYENFLGNHKRLLAHIEKRAQSTSWSLVSSPFADIFLTETEFISSYRSYFKSYSYYLTTVDNNRVASPAFSRFLDECKDNSLTRLGIESLLIHPIQHVPRYVILLQKLLTATWAEHPDYIPTRQAQQMMKALAVSLDCSNDEARDSIQKNKEEDIKIEKTSLALRKQKKPQRRKEQLKLSLSVKPGDIDILEKVTETECDEGGCEIFTCHIGGWLCAVKQVALGSDSPTSSPGGDRKLSMKKIDKEMKILESLPFHQNIMRYLFHDTLDGHLRIFITRYDCTLQHVLNCRRKMHAPLTISEIVTAALEIVRGLIFLHENHIVHRDIRSANVWGFKKEWGSGPGLIKLAIGNFDCSKVLAKSEKARTMIGNISFMAPEVLSSQPYTQAADVYGFGMILYEMMTLTRPYEGLSNNEITKKVLAGDRPPLQARGEQMIPLISLFEECTQLDPAKRLPLSKVKRALVEIMT